MAFVKKDRVRETSLTTGTGAIALAGAPNGYQPFSAVMSVGDTCWYAIVAPGSAWETGLGTYSAASTLTRTTVLESSNSNAAVSFGVGTKDVFICQPASQAQPAFPSGTLMLFQQTSAPTYWTKQATHNDKVLRVVSGTTGSGGTNAFSTVMAQTTVGNHTPTVSEMASHTHGHNANSDTGGNEDGGGGPGSLVAASGATISANGSSVAHNHTIMMDVAYVDVIVAQKD